MKLSGRARSQRADVVNHGVRYGTRQEESEVVISDAANSAARTISLGEEPDGYFNATDPPGRGGDRSKYWRECSQDWPLILGGNERRFGGRCLGPVHPTGGACFPFVRQGL